MSTHSFRQEDFLSRHFGCFEPFSTPEQDISARLLEDLIFQSGAILPPRYLQSSGPVIHLILENPFGQDTSHLTLLFRPDLRSPVERAHEQRFFESEENFANESASGKINTTPERGEMAGRLARAVTHWHQQMRSTGRCAYAVQAALEEVGLDQFVGCGNAWDMLEPLEQSGLFVRVSEDEADIGDIIVRPPSSDPSQNSVHGDISIITERNGDTIIQTNDASYEYVRGNPRYDGKAVFLRYVGK